MRGLARLLVRLYPARWRARYGEEFEALMEDSSSSGPAIFDLLKGAIRMQLSVPAFPKLALILSIAGLLAGLLVSSVVTRRYVSTTELRFSTPFAEDKSPDARRNLTERVIQLEQEVLSRSSLLKIIQHPILDLYPEDRARKPIEDVIQRMRRDISIVLDTPRLNTLPGASPDGVTFRVMFEYPDRVKAQQTVQALLSRFLEMNLTEARSEMQLRTNGQIERMEARLAALEKRLGMPAAPPAPADQLLREYSGEKLEVIDPPSLPDRPAKPNRWIFMADGFGAGFIAALLIALFRRRPPPMPLPAQTA
jgi:hypothetical protein